ncbi:hypothetical protein [Photobacterium lutimaris]|uniref:Uncharacterized protein n=1 Tax=Photobacterium lutimaris TaxID=388278 RepID=A0A2T3ITT5_9GAMM|nr:hypothetical protein [Photobacterium lutimaris]PSU31751.1 hypothetical protein C9I99_21445 [Photobacterium lutimaris]TDR72600.1 hypothetical protein DFP78_11376 [Photobacterium lutimaris]
MNIEHKSHGDFFNQPGVKEFFERHFEEFFEKKTYEEFYIEAVNTDEEYRTDLIKRAKYYYPNEFAADFQKWLELSDPFDLTLVQPQ